MIQAPIYMEKINPSNNEDKFWLAGVDGKMYWVHFGRRGTKGQQRIKHCKSENAASAMFVEAVAKKKNEGYIHSLQPPDLVDWKTLVHPSQLEPPLTPASEYYLTWTVKKAGVIAEDIVSSYELTHRILQAVDHSWAETIHLMHGHEGRPYVIFGQESDQLHFGHYPESFLKSLTPFEAKVVANNGTSRDGWLSPKGTGTGIIMTMKSNLDFTVRLYLSILKSISDNMEVQDSEEFDLDGRCFAIPEHPDTFQWYSEWETLEPAIESHWFIQGQTAKVVFDTPFANL